MTSREARNPRVILQEDHRKIETLLDRLIAAIPAGDREAYRKVWAKTEAALLTHLDVEEMFVLPELRNAHGAEVDRLRHEHDGIRRELGELGLAVNLHTIRGERIESFCAALREHAEREESLAYIDAERRLSIGVARSIAYRLKDATASARRSRTRGGYHGSPQ